MDTDHLIRVAAFLGILLPMGCWEAVAPRRQSHQRTFRRWTINLGLALTNTLVLRLVFVTGAMGAAFWAEQEEWGLFHVLNWPRWSEILVAIGVLDLVVYGQHIFFHRIPILWRLHKVHHSDIEFDVTTGVRFHPLEIVISMMIKIATILLLGVAPGAVLIFEVLLNATAMFNHSNVRIPSSVDRRLRWIVVTPDMHRVHHSMLSEETDRNFGFHLPWWDRLFGTYQSQPCLGHEFMTIGLGQWRNPSQLTWWRLLALPFLKDKERSLIRDHPVACKEDPEQTGDFEKPGNTREEVFT